MGSIVKFIALSGGNDEKPPCYLLEIDDFRILLDCGLSFNLDFSLLEPLKKYANKIDAILLSNSDILHIGGLPYAIGKLGLTGTVYGTTPVLKMGTMFLYDLYENKMAQEEFDQFNLDNVDACFGEDRFKELSFSQHYVIPNKGISITPYLAGHQVGSSVWKITKGTYSIIYAVDFNHRNEGHLDSLQLTSDILKPSLLITESRGVDRTLAFKKIATRDQTLLEKIHGNLRQGGNVLLPVDTAGRVLELLLCIENYWVKNRLSLYNVVFLGRFSLNVCQFAKSQLEFMSSSASIRFEQKIENPFTFRHIKIIQSIEKMNEEITTNTPKVILTSSQDLETGYSRDLFINWCSDPKNLILFTNFIPNGSLAEKVLNISKNTGSSNKTIEVEQGSRVPLEGEELKEYEEKIQKEKEEKLLEQLKKEQEEQEERERLELEEKSKQMLLDSEHHDNDDGDDTYGMNGHDDLSLTNGGATIINDSILNYKNPFETKHDLSRQHFKQQGLYTMFPYFEKNVKWGDYGEEDEEFIERNQNKLVEDITMEEEEDIEQEIPEKIVTKTYQCEVNCKVDSIDYEGVSDGRSIKTIIQQIAPTNLVLIRGKKEQSSNIEHYVKENMRTKGIFTPSINQELDLTSGTNVYELILKDSLVNQLKQSKILDCEVSYIQGKVDIVDQQSQQINTINNNINNNNNNNGNENSDIPYLDVLPIEQNNGHDESFIGDVKLSDLKQVLVGAGIKVQFDQGVLNCNDLVYIWREDVNGSSVINVDGIISDEYYLVKELLYKQFQIV